MNKPKKLQDVRLSKGLSQSQLARIVGVRAQRINRWERGPFDPKLANQIKIAQAFQMPLAELQALCNWPITPDVVIVGLEALK